MRQGAAILCANAWDGDEMKLCGRAGDGENLRERDGTGKFLGWVRMNGGALFYGVTV